jgi:F-type H+-transporting ATPase subunit delta
VAADPVIARNYAKALLHVVKKDGLDLNMAQEESRSLRHLLRDQPKLRVFLEGPQFREEDKERLVKNVLHGKINDLFFRYFILTLRRNRVECLADSLRFFEDMVENDKGIVPGVVTSAIALDQELQQFIQNKLEAFCNKRFAFRFKVDPNLIGGIRVKYEDILIDSSISTFLDDLRYRLESIRLAS